MEYFERIQNYLFDQMSESERARFEKEVDQNEALARELEIQRFANETIDQLEEDSLRARASKLRAEKVNDTNVKIKTPEIVPQKSKWYLWSTAAAILLLIGYFFFMNKETTKFDIITYGYQIAQIDYQTSTRGGNPKDPFFDDQFISILESLDEEQATKAISYFSNIESSNPATKAKTEFNLAHAYILNKDFNKAIGILTKLEQSEFITDRDKEEVIFIKALAYLGTKDKSIGASLLTKINQESNNRFAPKANELLKKLN